MTHRHHFEMLLELLFRLLASGFAEETEVHTAVGTMLQEPGVTFKTVAGAVFQDKESKRGRDRGRIALQANPSLPPPPKFSTPKALFRF